MQNQVDIAAVRDGDDLTAIYPVLAANFLEMSGAHVLFTTLKQVGIDALQALVPEHERQFWACSCCDHFFSGYLNTVYFDTNTGEFESAFLPKNLIESLDISDAWRAIFLDLRTKILSSPAGKLFDPSERLGLDNDIRTKKFLKTQDFSAARTTLGHAERGGFNHFHAGYLTSNPTTNFGKQWRQTIASIETLCEGRDLSGIARHARVFGELVETNKDGRYRKQMHGLAAMLDELHKHTVPGYHMAPYFKMIAVSIFKEDVGTGWGIMANFNGSALGTAFREGLATDDWQRAKATFEEMLDPIKYRAKQIEKVTEEQLLRAKAAIEKLGLVPALIRRYATPADMDFSTTVWKKPAPVVAKETKNPFDISLDIIKGEEAKIIDHNEMSEISWASFMETVLKEYSDIEVYIQGSGAYFYFTVPTDPTAAPILSWDSPKDRIPWCTSVRQENTLPNEHGLVNGSWYPLEMVIKATLGNYYFCTVQSKSVRQAKDGVSFGSVIRKDLYEHRGPIDHVLKTVGVESVEGPLIGLRQGGQGCRRLMVRGVRNNVRKSFTIVNVL